MFKSFRNKYGKGRPVTRKEACELWDTVKKYYNDEPCQFKNGWLKIGEIPVDTAKIMIADPFSVQTAFKPTLDVFSKGEHCFNNCDEVLENVHGSILHGLFGQDDATGAIVVSTAEGDGGYEVFARMKDFNGRKVITTVKIDTTREWFD